MSLKKLLALRAFAMDYHSGQSSRGYELLCLANLRLKANHYDKYSDPWRLDRLTEMARRTRTYKTLVERYGDKV